MTKTRTNEDDKALVVLSGGQDSTTCLFWAIQKWGQANVHAVTFNYGQRHHRELGAAKQIASLGGIGDRHEVVDIGPILKSTSPLVSNTELEQYADHNSLPGGLEKTFVPMRNTLFLTLAANRAYELRAFNIVTGVCEEDYGGYPDCRERFINKLQDAFNESLNDGDLDEFHPKYNLLTIHTPLMHLTKAESVHLALSLEGCYDALAYSHTAYDGAYPPVGHDHATLLRTKGFEEAGYPDPLVVRAHKEGLMDLPDTPNYDSIREGN